MLCLLNLTKHRLNEQSISNPSNCAAKIILIIYVIFFEILVNEHNVQFYFNNNQSEIFATQQHDNSNWPIDVFKRLTDLSAFSTTSLTTKFAFLKSKLRLLTLTYRLNPIRIDSCLQRCHLYYLAATTIIVYIYLWILLWFSFILLRSLKGDFHKRTVFKNI